MRAIYAMFLICFLVWRAGAQGSAHQKKWYFTVQAAVLSGDHASGWQAGISGGIKLGGWELGTGALVDAYKLRSVPCYIEIRRYAGKRQHWFGYLDAGVNIPWPISSQRPMHWDSVRYVNDQLAAGFYGEIGGGYRFTIAGKHIGLSFGYSQKTMPASYPQTLYTTFPPYTASYYTRRDNYIFNRLLLRLSIGL